MRRCYSIHKMEPERFKNQVRIIEEMKSMAEALREIENLSKSLASRTKRVTTMNASSTDKLMSSLKMKMDEINRELPSQPPKDNSFDQPSSESDISEIVIKEVERQLEIEIDLANAYRELEEKSRKLKHYVSTTLPRFSLDGDFGQLPMIQAVKNYHDAVATASRNFDGVPKLTAKLLRDLQETSVSDVGGIRDLSFLKDKLRHQYEILRRAKGRVGHNSQAASFAGEPSQHDLETAGWQRFGE